MKKDLLLLLALTLPSFAALVRPGYFPMHDDLQSMRQYQLDLCFKDGQFPCRWVPHLGYGYGYPLFNYYPPLPYLIGQPFRWLGLQYIDVVKAVGIVGFITTAGFMYLLGRQFWGRAGGFISAAFYTYAPYHSVDYYVRAAVNEFWAMAFYPAVFWTTYRLIADRRPSWLVAVALSVAAVMLSHNPMLMIFAPVLVVWCLYWVFKLKAWSALIHLAAAAVWSVGLAAFFTLPVVFESKFVSLWTLTSGYFNYLAHFLDLRQIFLTINWGYGSSELGPADTMSFALGYLHWIVPVAILLLAPFIKPLRSKLSLIILLVLFTITALFLAHSKSTPVWQALKPLEFLQFPWRFLTLAVFLLSFASGAVALVSRRIVPLFLLLILLLNANYFRPREWYPAMTDSEKFSGKNWQLLVTSGIFDYLPIWAPAPPADPAGSDISLVAGVGEAATISKRSNFQEYRLKIQSPAAVAQIETYYFPGWRVWLDDQPIAVDPARDPLLGRMQIDVPAGSHTLVARFTNTPVRNLGNLLSVLAWLAVGMFWLRQAIARSSTPA